MTRTSAWHTASISAIPRRTSTRSRSAGCRLHTNSHSLLSVRSRAHRICGKRSPDIPCNPSVSKNDMIHLRACPFGKLRKSCSCQGILPALPSEPFPFPLLWPLPLPLLLPFVFLDGSGLQDRSAILCNAARKRVASISPSISKRICTGGCTPSVSFLATLRSITSSYTSSSLLRVHTTSPFQPCGPRIHTHITLLGYGFSPFGNNPVFY